MRVRIALLVAATGLLGAPSLSAAAPAPGPWVSYQQSFSGTCKPFDANGNTNSRCAATSTLNIPMVEVGQKLSDGSVLCCPAPLNVTLVPNGPQCFSAGVDLEAGMRTDGARVRAPTDNNSASADLRPGKAVTTGLDGWFTGPWSMDMNVSVIPLSSSQCGGTPGTNYSFTVMLGSRPNTGSVGTPSTCVLCVVRARKLGPIRFITAGGGRYLVRVFARGPGGRRIVYGKATASSVGPASLSVNVPPSSAARAVLRRGGLIQFAIVVYDNPTYGRFSSASFNFGIAIPGR